MSCVHTQAGTIHKQRRRHYKIDRVMGLSQGLCTLQPPYPPSRVRCTSSTLALFNLRYAPSQHFLTVSLRRDLTSAPRDLGHLTTMGLENHGPGRGVSCTGRLFFQHCAEVALLHFFVFYLIIVNGLSGAGRNLGLLQKPYGVSTLPPSLCGNEGLVGGRSRCTGGGWGWGARRGVRARPWGSRSSDIQECSCGRGVAREDRNIQRGVCENAASTGESRTCGRVPTRCTRNISTVSIQISFCTRKVLDSVRA